MAAEQFEPTQYRWSYTPVGKPFDGCIRNIVHNSKLYDLADPGLFRNSKVNILLSNLVRGIKTIYHTEVHYDLLIMIMIYLAWMWTS